MHPLERLDLGPAALVCAGAVSPGLDLFLRRPRGQERRGLGDVLRHRPRHDQVALVERHPPAAARALQVALRHRRVPAREGQRVLLTPVGDRARPLPALRRLQPSPDRRLLALVGALVDHLAGRAHRDEVRELPPGRGPVRLLAFLWHPSGHRRPRADVNAGLADPLRDRSPRPRLARVRTLRPVRRAHPAQDQTATLPAAMVALHGAAPIGSRGAGVAVDRLSGRGLDHGRGSSGQCFRANSSCAIPKRR